MIGASSLLLADFTRTNGVVTDNTTNLQWQDDVASVSKTWSQAITYCETLSLDGRSDWRLPNKNELLSIVDYTKFNPAIDSTFVNITSSSYLSSTTYSSSTNYAWRINFYYGSTHYNRKDVSDYVRCVRGG
jgi:hypothetical protein